MRAKSSASVNSTGACSEAATVCPGSILRVSTMPSMGERIEALDRLVWSERNEAAACAAAARALASLASARDTAASALSNSLGDGTLPPDSSATRRRRAKLAEDSFTVARICATCASADITAACDLITWSFSLERSSRTNT